MAEFLELLESLRVQDATLDNMFGDTKGDVSHRLRSRNTNPKYKANLAEAAVFLSEIMSGTRPIYHLREVMSRSDFPLLFGDIMDRQLYGTYREYPVFWNTIARRTTAPDFRTLQRFFTDGGDDGTTKVDELTEYPEAKMNEGRYQLTIAKYGRRMGFSWETMINDDIDFVRTAPERLARGARRTEDRFVTDIFVGPNGPDAALYSVGNANIITANPVLTLAGLQTALTNLANQTYLGEPIFIDMVTLVVPPALEIVAKNILNATELRLSGTAAGAAASTEMMVANWMRNRVNVVVNPYIPILATSANGNTSWFLFASPGDARPAIEVAFLRGRETPELFQKAPNALRLGGGAADPMDGSYEIDAIEWKVRHVFGGGVVDPKMTVASNGTGS